MILNPNPKKQTLGHGKKEPERTSHERGFAAPGMRLLVAGPFALSRWTKVGGLVLDRFRLDLGLRAQGLRCFGLKFRVYEVYGA